MPHPMGADIYCTCSGGISLGRSLLLCLIRQAHVDDLPSFTRASDGFSLEDQGDSPRVTDIEQESVGGPPLDPVSRFHEKLRGGIPVFCDP